MKKIFNWVKDNPNRSMFLLPIILVAGISISHVVSWYDIANPFSWAIYLSIAIEVGAMTALVAATNKIKGGVWFMFGLITLIQMIGNIFFSFKEIDANGNLFKSWVELTGPLWEMMGSDPTDVVSMKRWLAFLEGGLLPVISLTSLHFFVKYESNNTVNEGTTDGVNEGISEEDDDIEYSEPNENLINAKKVWEKVNELREEGKLPPSPTEEELVEEPTALAFTPYEIDETLETPEETLITDGLEEVLEEETTEEKVQSENTKFPIDKMLEFDDLMTTTTTTNDGIRRLSYVKNI
jgi:hypothetical protein